MLAHHYRAALEHARALGHPVEDLAEPARLAFRDAGRRAYALNAFASAARYFADALALWPDDAQRPRLLLPLAYAQYYAGEEARERTLEQARDALLASGDREGAAEADALLSELWWHRGHTELAHEYLDHARELVAETPASSAKARVLSEVSRYLMLAGRDAEALGPGLEALAIAEQLGLAEIQAHALNNLGTAKHQLGDESGIADLERSIEIALAVRSPEAARGYNNLGACVADFDFRRSTELFREAVRVGEQLGNPPVVRYSRAQVLSALYARGDWHEFVPLADEFLASGEAGYSEAWLRLDRAAVRLASGDETQVVEDVRRSLELARQAADPQVLLPVLALAIDLLVGLERLEEAQALADELKRALEEGRGQPWMTSDAAWVAERVGLSDALREFASATSTGRAESVLEILDRNFAALAERAEAEGRSLRAARAHLCAAEQLVARGRRAEADVHLGKALAFYRSVGATRWVRKAETLLVAAS